MTSRKNEKSEFPAQWFIGMSDKDKQETLNTLRFNPVLRRLLEIVEGFQKEADRTPNYDTASWAYRQAHQNGAREAYEKIKTLLTPSQQT